ncbi:MAG: hypothetical protein IJ944_03385 [Clostridia bacterium]|nr:hypothetical protein [Clostridia bacterium]
MKKVLSVILSMVMVMCILPIVSAEVTIYGDVDGDGVVNAIDSLNVLYYGVGKTEFTDAQLVAADVTGNGVVNAEDALLVLQRSVGKITYFSAVEDPSEVEPPFVDTTPEVVKIHPDNFPDDYFFEYVYEVIDLNGDFALSEYEISKVTELYVGNYEYYPEDPNKIPYHEITTLKGIEFFTELEILSCDRVRLTELDVSKNTKLKELSCSSNLDLTSIDVSNNLLLENLNCFYTGITELDLSCNENLDNLQCSWNNIETLDLTNNTKLRILSCYNTNITSLDLTNNTNLTRVACDAGVELIGYTGKRTEY